MKKIIFASFVFVFLCMVVMTVFNIRNGNWQPKISKQKSPKIIEQGPIEANATLVIKTKTIEHNSLLKQELESSVGSTEGMEDDAIERIEWELKKLRDPVTGHIPEKMRLRELAFAATLPTDEIAGLHARSIPNWTNRGPWNVGGRTRAFGVDVSNENRLLAGAVSGGMWLSTNGGGTWAKTSDASVLKSVTCLAQDTRTGHTKTWYYGGGEGSGASPSGDGAYYNGDGLSKSEDGGLSWTPILSTTNGSPQSFSTNWQIVWNLASDVSAPDTQNRIYAACYSSIYRSNNGGKDWTTLFSSGGYYTDVTVSKTGIVYATCSSDGAQKGIWRSEDGINFVKIQPKNFPASFKRMVICIDPNDENKVYFLCHTPGFGKISTNYLGDKEYNSFYTYNYIKGNGTGDTGGYWRNISANLPSTGGQFDKWNVQGGYDMVVKVKPGDSNTVFIGGTNLYRSTSAFKDSINTTFIGGYEQFSKLPTINGYANHHPDQHGIAFSPSNPNKMFSYNDGGISITDNNSSATVVWNSLNNGYLSTQFYTVAIDHATTGNNVIIGGAQDNGSWYINSADPASPWVQPRGGDGSYCAIANNRTAYYFSIQNAKMMRTTLDANGNKTAFTRIDPIGIKGFEFINPFILDPNDNNLMYLSGGKYLWRNNNLSGIPMVGGWDSISTNWVKWKDSIPVANVKISCITACKTPANRIYLGTNNRKLYKIDNANTGTPALVDITSATSGNIFPAGGNINCVAVDPNDGNKLIVVFSNYNIYSVFYSADGGTTWSKQAGNLEPSDGSGPSIRWASIVPVSDGTIYLLATSTGIYATANLAGTNTVWVQQGTNTIGNVVCGMFDYRTTDGLVVVATHANGIFSANYTTVNNIVKSKDFANNSNPISIYPNPVKNKLNIHWEFTQSTAIKIEILDNCGRLISREIIANPSTGMPDFTIDVSKLNSGTYYCSVIADTSKKTMPFIILK